MSSREIRQPTTDEHGNRVHDPSRDTGFFHTEVPPSAAGSLRWDGPSPYAGRDSRTQAQKDHDAATVTITLPGPYEGTSRRIAAILQNVKNRGWEPGEAAELKRLLQRWPATGVTGPPPSPEIP